MAIIAHTNHHPSSAGLSCTVQMKTKDFCDAPAWPDAPFPICRSHAIELYMAMRGIHNDAIIEQSGFTPDLNANKNPYSLAMEQIKQADAEARNAASVVYYVRIGKYIKIGYTNNLAARMTSLRVAREHVLATEPGGREQEAKRHAQFKRLRKGRMEDFEPTFQLIQHIDAIRERYGRPVFKATRKVAVKIDA